MHTIRANTVLSPNVHRLVLDAPLIAKKRQPGQFVMVRLGPGHERIPLTIADSDATLGTITLVIQAVGVSTKALVALQPGEAIRDVAGPLGRATDLIDKGHAVCVGGGVGTAVVYPIAQALARRGVQVTSVVGGRSTNLVILRDELSALGRLEVCTDDGSLGRKGFVTDALRDLCQAGGIDIVYAVGPVPMMRAVADLTRGFKLHTIVSLNPVMIDGTGMCGGCRVTVGGKQQFACVDGPEFDGHQVDFAEMWSRLGTYKEMEKRALEDHACRLAGAAAAPSAATR
jgi:ferredoxin--NADP+ reductase